MQNVQERLDARTIKRSRLLSDVVTAEGVELRRSGEGRYRGRCPFHDDSTPSLLVDDRDGHYHCFGCGAHGDAIDFVSRRRGLSFTDACRALAESGPAPGKPGVDRKLTHVRRWERLRLDEQVVMNTAGAIYQHTLWRTPKALEYLRSRGIPDRVTRECGVGYSDGHSLEGYLRRTHGLRAAQELGLLRRQGGLRELMANRVVVPEIRSGQYIWFIGRLIEERAGSPKYLALGGGRPVLGYERAAGRAEVFLCEGVFDFLTAVAWKLPAFSACGTSLPADRLGFLARARVVWGVLDGDEAGRRAAERFGEQLGARWRPLQLPGGRDLSDLAREPEGRATFERLLAASRHRL